MEASTAADVLFAHPVPKIDVNPTIPINVSRRHPPPVRMVWVVFAADVSTVAGIQELAQAYGTREKSLDILVNNAGISDGGLEIEDVTEKVWDSVIDLNLKSIFYTIQAFLPFLRVGASPDTPRNVFNIASIDGCGKLNAFYNYAYGASKAAVIQLSRHLGDR